MNAAAVKRLNDYMIEDKVKAGIYEDFEIDFAGIGIEA